MKKLKEAKAKLDAKEGNTPPVPQARYAWGPAGGNEKVLKPKFVKEGTNLKSVLVVEDEMGGMDPKTFQAYREENNRLWEEQTRADMLRVKREGQEASYRKTKNDLEEMKLKQGKMKHAKLIQELAEEETIC